MHHDDPRIQELVKNKHFDGFTLVPDKGGHVKVEFVKGGKTLSMDPWKDSSMTLRHLHRLSCPRFNDDTAAKIKAVISVPANFTHFQRAADAAALPEVRQ